MNRILAIESSRQPFPSDDLKNRKILLMTLYQAPLGTAAILTEVRSCATARIKSAVAAGLARGRPITAYALRISNLVARFYLTTATLDAQFKEGSLPSSVRHADVSDAFWLAKHCRIRPPPSGTCEQNFSISPQQISAARSMRSSARLRFRDA